MPFTVKGSFRIPKGVAPRRKTRIVRLTARTKRGRGSTVVFGTRREATLFKNKVSGRIQRRIQRFPKKKRPTNLKLKVVGV